MRTQSSSEHVRPVNSTLLSELLVRSLVWCAFRLVARPLFRIRVLGREHIPSRGPALLVSNHLTYVDAFLIGSCLTPVVRFLAWKPYYDHKLLNWGFRIGKTIPIGEDLPSATQAIERARNELQAGHVLCIFAEGSISRTGELLPFKRGLEAIARGVHAPIIPVHLSGLLESVFGFEGGRVSWMQRLRRLRHPVVISFGPPMPASSTAAEARQAVAQLGARACAARTAD
jgi:acyl-[acyl-carrier-protein]-phospholipid O-acyltransferase/long-chain-fatty-acid--[acyl-carrier-protein] ligase